MFKVNNKQNLCSLLIQLLPKNTLINNNNVYIYSKIKIFYLTNFYFVDISFFNSKLNNFSKITYNLFRLKNFKPIQITLLNINKIYSNSHNINILDWYERELYENSNFTIYNIKDIRNLILPYSYKFYKGFTYQQQKYQNSYTNLSNKKVFLKKKNKINL